MNIGMGSSTGHRIGWKHDRTWRRHHYASILDAYKTDLPKPEAYYMQAIGRELPPSQIGRLFNVFCMVSSKWSLIQEERVKEIGKGQHGLLCDKDKYAMVYQKYFFKRLHTIKMLIIGWKK